VDELYHGSIVQVKEGLTAFARRMHSKVTGMVVVHALWVHGASAGFVTLLK